MLDQPAPGLAAGRAPPARAAAPASALRPPRPGAKCPLIIRNGTLLARAWAAGCPAGVKVPAWVPRLTWTGAAPVLVRVSFWLASCPRVSVAVTLAGVMASCPAFRDQSWRVTAPEVTVTGAVAAW